jgi:hypothetical protein
MTELRCSFFISSISKSVNFFPQLRQKISPSQIEILQQGELYDSSQSTLANCFLERGFIFFITDLLKFMPQLEQ